MLEVRGDDVMSEVNDVLLCDGENNRFLSKTVDNFINKDLLDSIK